MANREISRGNHTYGYNYLGNGQAAWFDDVQYGVQHISNNIFMYSVGISYRGLRDNEQLDFSKTNGNDQCATYLYSAGRNTPSEYIVAMSLL